MPTTFAGTPATVVQRGTAWRTTEPGGDPGAFADLDVAEDLGAGADQHAAPDLRVPVAALLAGPAESHVLEHGDVVLDHGRRPDDEPGRVVEEDAASDPGGGVDVGLEHLGGAALEVEGEVLPPPVPEPMGEPVRLDRVEALEVEDAVRDSGCRRDPGRRPP